MGHYLAWGTVDRGHVQGSGADLIKVRGVVLNDST